jgi:pimeloyl-[acyl-carrier protein] methyl ester esterase
VTALNLREAGSGPPVMFLHGWSCHGGFFADQMAALADRHHVLAPDLPGHGRSSAADDTLSIGAAADALLEFLQARSLSEVTLIGWSMGAHVAYAMLERGGGVRIASLAVVDMTPKVLNDDGWSLGIRTGLDGLRSERAVSAMQADWRTYAPPIVDNMFADRNSVSEATRTFALAEIAANDPTAMVAMWRSLCAQDFRALLPTIALPVTIAHGALSRLYAEETARYQAEHIPGSRVVRFARSGHSPHLEEPEAFIELVRSLCPHPSPERAHGPSR